MLPGGSTVLLYSLHDLILRIVHVSLVGSVPDPAKNLTVTTADLPGDVESVVPRT